MAQPLGAERGEVHSDATQTSEPAWQQEAPFQHSQEGLGTADSREAVYGSPGHGTSEHYASLEPAVHDSFAAREDAEMGQAGPNLLQPQTETIPPGQPINCE